MSKREYQVCSNCVMDTSDSKIVFDEKDNQITDILNGKIKFHQYLAPYVPAENIVNVLEFDPTMLATALNGGGN